MRRTALLVVAVVAALACTGVARSEPPVAGTVTLAGWASSPAETALLQGVVAAFEATHPRIHVDLETIGGDYRAELERRFAAGDSPDVFYVDASYARKWMGMDALMPLNSFIRASAFETSPFFDPLLAAFTGPGNRVYGLPKDWSPLALYGNQTLLNAAEVTPPATWQQLEAAAEQIATTGVTPLCIEPTWARLMAFVYQNGGSFLSADGRHATVDTPSVAQALEFVLGLFDAGLAKTPAQLGAGWCGQAFADGLAAMTPEGNWLAPFLATFPQLDYTISSLPEGVEAGNVAFTVSYSIAEASTNKRAAWELVSFLTGVEGMTLWTQGGLALPARDDVVAPAGREAFLAQAGISHVWQFPIGFDSVLTFADQQLAAVLAGSQTVEGMLAAIQAAADAALATD